MVNGIRASEPRGLNKGRDSKFYVGSQVRQETSEEGRRTYQPKRNEYDDKDEDNSPKTLNDKNKQKRKLSFPSRYPSLSILSSIKICQTSELIQLYCYSHTHTLYTFIYAYYTHTLIQLHLPPHMQICYAYMHTYSYRHTCTNMYMHYCAKIVHPVEKRLIVWFVFFVCISAFMGILMSMPSL